MSSLKSIWKGHSINLCTKLKLWKALVWSTASYGCENWTIGKNDERRLNAFEMKGLRQILRILWTMHRRNEAILKDLNYKLSFLKLIR